MENFRRHGGVCCVDAVDCQLAGITTGEEKYAYHVHVISILKATLARVAAEAISHYMLVKDVLALEKLMTVNGGAQWPIASRCCSRAT